MRQIIVQLGLKTENNENRFQSSPDSKSILVTFNSDKKACLF